jgi:CHAD domain-containing protein
MSQHATNKFPLLDYLDSLVSDLRTLAPKAISDTDPDAIHDARVASRRLKAALDLLEPCIGNKHRRPLEKISRSLRRRLGEVRDLDVMLDHLKEINSARPAAAIEWFDKSLKAAREKAVVRAAKSLPPAKVLSRLGSWFALRQEIIAAREAVHSLLAESIHLQLDTFVHEYERKTDPHPIRIAAKSLRYTIEMARAEKLPIRKPVVAQFKRLQDALGLWHDYVVIAERLMSDSVDQMLAHHNADLQQAVLSLAALFINRSKHQLARVEKMWQKNGPKLTQQIKQALPLTTEIAPTSVQPPPPAPQPTLYPASEEKI